MFIIRASLVEGVKLLKVISSKLVEITIVGMCTLETELIVMIDSWIVQPENSLTLGQAGHEVRSYEGPRS